MEAHAGDFRSEVEKDELSRGASQDTAAARAAALAAAVKADWRAAGLPPADVALCTWAEKLTRTPGACGAADLAPLRAVGFDDTAIHDAAQAISYFNYINRVADGLGVDLEPEMKQK